MPISSGCQKCRDKGCRTNFYSIQTAITQNSRHPTLPWQKIMSKGMFCPQTQTTESLGKMARPSFSLLLLLSCSPDIDSTELILGKNNKTTRRKNRRVQVRTSQYHPLEGLGEGLPSSCESSSSRSLPPLSTPEVWELPWLVIELQVFSLRWMALPE